MWLGLGKYFDVCLAVIKIMNYVLHLFRLVVILVNVAQLLTTNLMEAVNFLRKVVENLEPHFVVKVIFCSFPLPFCTSATAAPAHNGSLPDSTLSLLWAQNGNQSYCIQEKGVLHEPNKKSLENMITRTRKGFLMVFSLQRYYTSQKSKPINTGPSPPPDRGHLRGLGVRYNDGRTMGASKDGLQCTKMHPLRHWQPL